VIAPEATAFSRVRGIGSTSARNVAPSASGATRRKDTPSISYSNACNLPEADWVSENGCVDRSRRGSNTLRVAATIRSTSPGSIPWTFNRAFNVVRTGTSPVTRLISDGRTMS
jgi:hypothetical protein